MVDREHVPRAEPAAEEVQNESQQRPPCRGAAEEARDHQHGAHEASEARLRVSHARDLEYGEEGQDVGDDHDEVGDREAEDRHEVLHEARLARPVAADLRHGVLREDVDPDDHHEDAARDPQQRVVLLDVALEHRVEEERGHRHEGVGAGYAESRDDARAAVFRERALDA